MIIFSLSPACCHKAVYQCSHIYRAQHTMHRHSLQQIEAMEKLPRHVAPLPPQTPRIYDTPTGRDFYEGSHCRHVNFRNRRLMIIRRIEARPIGLPFTGHASSAFRHRVYFSQPRGHATDDEPRALIDAAKINTLRSGAADATTPATRAAAVSQMPPLHAK